MSSIRTTLRNLRDRVLEEGNRSMWKNFSTSILLLGVAMMAALYSSSATRDGRMIASAVSAMIALGIAIWVGVRFVPRLAANVEWDWIPFLSNYTVTREGWIYLGAITIVIFAAINTSNNLLYMVLSALLAVLMLSGFLAGINFRHLRVDVRLPAHCFAGETFPMSLQVHNRKSIFPTFSIEIEPAQDSAFRFPECYLLVVRAQSQSFHPVEAMLSRRGRYELKSVRANSRYPFGFFAKWRECRTSAECICYPEILPLDRLGVASLDILGSNPRFERGNGYDLYTIRDYVPSDSARHVHWKATAKSAVLKTREYAAEESRRVALHFDRYGEPGDETSFEQLVSRAASLAFHLIHAGVEVELIGDEWRSGFGSADIHIESILGYLALVQMAPDAGMTPDSDANAMVLSLRRHSTVSA